MKMDKTFKSNFVSYKILDDLILRILRKLAKANEPGMLSQNITQEDLKYASINYKMNTEEAIRLSKENKVSEFFILSLPARQDYTQLMQNKFFLHYKERVEEIITNNNIKLIDLSNLKKGSKKLFCDYAHKTLDGNKLVAKTVYEYLKKNSKYFD